MSTGSEQTKMEAHAQRHTKRASAYGVNKSVSKLHANYFVSYGLKETKSFSECEGNYIAGTSLHSEQMTSFGKFFEFFNFTLRLNPGPGHFLTYSD